MGLAGHAIMWKALRNATFVKLRIDTGVVGILNSTCWYLASSVTAGIVLCYAYKIFNSFGLVMNEFLNEVR